MISMRKESRVGEPVKGIFWVSLAIIGFAALVLLVGYLQKTRSLEKVSTRIETVQFLKISCTITAAMFPRLCWMDLTDPAIKAPAFSRLF